MPVPFCHCRSIGFLFCAQLYRDFGYAEVAQHDFIGQMAEQICPHVFVLRLGEQIFREQDFIGRGSDFRHENFVAMIVVWLVFA